MKRKVQTTVFENYAQVKLDDLYNIKKLNENKQIDENQPLKEWF